MKNYPLLLCALASAALFSCNADLQGTVVVNSTATGITVTATPSASPSPNPSPSPSVIPEISAWTSVDGDGTSLGLVSNLSTFNFGGDMTAFNSKLYTISTEAPFNGITQVRVNVFNGNDAAPAWNFVDAGGLNRNTQAPAYDSRLVVLNSKLYAVWSEVAVINNSYGSNQIRVSVYNGNDTFPVWTSVDGGLATGLNFKTNINAVEPAYSVANGKLYLIWSEGSSVPEQIRVAVYNGTDTNPKWTFVDGGAAAGINKDSTKAATRPALGYQNATLGLYSTWEEVNASGLLQIRVSVYNGNDAAPKWTLVDGGGPAGINQYAAISQSGPALSAFNNKLYLTWSEANSPAPAHVRVSVYNGNDAAPAWAPVDGGITKGINKDPTQSAFASHFGVFNNKLYSSWSEINANGVFAIRSGVYNGNDAAPTWALVDGGGPNGLNSDPTRDGYGGVFTVLNGNLFNFWEEGDSQQTYVTTHVSLGIAVPK